MDKQKLYELKSNRAQALDAATAFLDEGKLEEYNAEMEKVKGYNAQIEAVENLLQENERYADQGGKPGQPGLEKSAGAEDGYAKAVKTFAAAARQGFKVSNAAGDLMQEGVDPDGGYTVPEDIVTKIINLREASQEKAARKLRR